VIIRNPLGRDIHGVIHKMICGPSYKFFTAIE
jgi:hypothetical protein